MPRRLLCLYGSPQWSQDGRWIALGDTLVPSGGGSSCTPFGRGVALAWAPKGHLVAAVTKRGGPLLGGPGHATRRLLPDGWGASGPVFDPRYSAACSPDGRLVAATVTANREEGRFDTAERSIWLLRTNGNGRRLLIGKPGDRISDEFPRWSHDGRWILYVEHRARPYAAASAYLVSLHTGRPRGPIAHIGGGLGYYGYHDWAALASWYQP